jgi:hypothetical protein
MSKSLRGTFALVALGLTILSGCSTTAQQTASRCYWPKPMYQDCREMIEFNSWH